MKGKLKAIPLLLLCASLAACGGGGSGGGQGGPKGGVDAKIDKTHSDDKSKSADAAESTDAGKSAKIAATENTVRMIFAGIFEGEQNIAEQGKKLRVKWAKQGVNLDPAPYLKELEGAAASQTFVADLKAGKVNIVEEEKAAILALADGDSTKAKSVALHKAYAQIMLIPNAAFIGWDIVPSAHFSMTFGADPYNAKVANAYMKNNAAATLFSKEIYETIVPQLPPGAMRDKSRAAAIDRSKWYAISDDAIVTTWKAHVDNLANDSCEVILGGKEVGWRCSSGIYSIGTGGIVLTSGVTKEFGDGYLGGQEYKTTLESSLSTSSKISVSAAKKVSDSESKSISATAGISQ